MAKNKTDFTKADVTDFVNSVVNEQKRLDSFRLIELMTEATGEAPKMYGPTIVGFGEYHYKYASGHEGNAPLLGFSPRKTAISLYIYCGQKEELLPKLGKFTMGKACIYVKKLSDLNEDVMKEIMQSSIDFITKKYHRIQ